MMDTINYQGGSVLEDKEIFAYVDHTLLKPTCTWAQFKASVGIKTAEDMKAFLIAGSNRLGTGSAELSLAMPGEEVHCR